MTRAGTTTPFWWGSQISTSQANYHGGVAYSGGSKGEVRGATVPVDTFAANAWGLYNVHGNVWDWTEDCWNASNTGNAGNGEARNSGDCVQRVLRGGAWHARRAQDLAIESYPGCSADSLGVFMEGIWHLWPLPPAEGLMVASAATLIECL